MTGEIFDGLDVQREIRVAADHGLGDTVLRGERSKLAGFAAYPIGSGTEAGSGACDVKFAAAQSGPEAEGNFERLLDACEALAAAHKASRLIAGMNPGRLEAYDKTVARGFRANFPGVDSEAGPVDSGCDRPDAFVIGGWR